MGYNWNRNMQPRRGGQNNRGWVGLPIESWPEEFESDGHLFGSCLNYSLKDSNNNSIVNHDVTSLNRNWEGANICLRRLILASTWLEPWSILFKTQLISDFNMIDSNHISN